MATAWSPAHHPLARLRPSVLRTPVPLAYATNSLCVSLLLQAGAVVSLGLAVGNEQYDLLLLIAGIFQVLAVAAYLKPGGIELLAPFSITLGTIAIAWCIRPLYLLFSDEPLTFTRDLHWEAAGEALQMVLAFSGLFVIGYMSRMGAWCARRLPAPHPRLWTAEREFRALVVMGVAAAGFLGLLIVSVGISLTAAYADWWNFRMVSGAEGMMYLSRMAVICLWSMFYIVLVRRVFTGFHALRLVVPGCLFSVSCLLTLPFGSRGYLMLPLVGALWLFDSFGILRLHVVRLAPFAFVLAIVLAVLAAYRNASRDGSASLERVVQEIEHEGTEGLIANALVRFDSFDFLLWTAANYPPPGEDFLYGRTLIDFLVQPIPRAFYANKAYKTSAHLVDLQMPDLERRFTPEYTLLSELFINFSFPGVVAGGLVFGVLIRAMEAYLDQHRHNPTVKLWYMPLVMSVMFWLFAGLNSDTSVFFLMSTAQTWFMHKFWL